ncbi:agmatine deiminase family protein [Leucobacter sp. M11]|uniref:agmatine deiminase family protein n=1 Tax=Leucobacter sp. M11 TaxID=2993565 RepID=UPI002D80D98D|nr:agmatine deiminase family protein [Leucobacter sp. M11]MEB4615860.1 agmatine deiminase family protein [Leucobacter sp. M11]
MALGALAACARQRPASERAPSAEHEGPSLGVMPDEGAPHTATWMSFGVRDEIWTAELAEGAREALLLIAATIARYEPVRALVNPGEGFTPIANVEYVTHPIDDLWIRDTGPTFIRTGTGTLGVDFNFNGWGNRQEHAADAAVAAGVCDLVGSDRVDTELVLEGGALEIDGEGTAIITESCVLNDNRNPGWSKADVEAELWRTLGIERVIWLPGIRGRDITDGHTDFYARFASPGVVVAGRDDDSKSFDYAVTREHLRILKRATDARGRRLKVHVLPAPETIREEWESDEFAAGYINFYVCNGAVIAPEFGDPRADEHARKTLAELYPDREIVQLNIDPIAAGGGGIHCATQQQPAAG